MNDDYNVIARLSSKSQLCKKRYLKGETLHVCIMCFVANSLSSMSLDVGSRSPLGQASGAFIFLRRSYNLKVTVSATNIVSGILATILVAIGDKSRIPYLYLPWLVNTIKGMAFCEGPALLGIAYVLLPNADLPATSFLFITLLLFVEELCLWNDVFNNFRKCWTDYENKRKSQTKNQFREKPEKSKQDVTHSVEHETAAELKTESVKSFKTLDAHSLYSGEPELCENFSARTSSPTVAGFLKPRTMTRNPWGTSLRTRYTSVTG